jgi:hypothetical protein
VKDININAMPFSQNTKASFSRPDYIQQLLCNPEAALSITMGIHSLIGFRPDVLELVENVVF